MQRCRWWKWRCRRWQARKLSSGPEKGQLMNEINHTCYCNQQVPNSFYRWLAYGLAAWAHLVPWDWLGQRACASKCLVGLYRVNKIFEILENWLYALCTRLAYFKRNGILFLVSNLETCHTSIFFQCFCAGRVDFMKIDQQSLFNCSTVRSRYSMRASTVFFRLVGLLRWAARLPDVGTASARVAWLG